MQQQRRRTKIVATIGPASDDTATLAAMAEGGTDVARVTLAHGTTDEAVERVRRLRRVLPQVGILVDLPGPKVRTAPFPDEGVILATDAEVIMVPDDGEGSSSAARIAVSHVPLIEGLGAGDDVAFGDGGVTLTVCRRSGAVGHARVRCGGPLRGRPGRLVRVH